MLFVRRFWKPDSHPAFITASLSFALPLQVLKVAILAEKYATDYKWYVDVILNLIRLAGDYVSEEVWYRVIQIVINRDDVQGYAAKTVFEALQVGETAHTKKRSETKDYGESGFSVLVLVKVLYPRTTPHPHKHSAKTYARTDAG